MSERDWQAAQSVTTEPSHTHFCPICMDSWRHEGSECEAGEESVIGYLRPQTWAKCPMHEGEAEP
jgi:galactose-1-phosphate uridylyltransferase